MAELLLDSLKIQNFRAFEALEIKKLGRVNLIVGKNNVGKTSLLEALWLYANRGAPKVIWQILRTRYDFNEENGRNAYQGIKNLFYERADIRQPPKAIKLGSIKSQVKSITISIDWYLQQIDDEGNIKRHRLEPKEYSTIGIQEPFLDVREGTNRIILHQLDLGIQDILPLGLSKTNCVTVFTNGLSTNQLRSFWDNIKLSDWKFDIIRFLQTINSEIKNVDIVGYQELIPKAQMFGLGEPISLSSLGEGLNHLFRLALALVNAKDGMLLIDEIESGLHYSVQADMWKLVFEVAERLNVQVFATTHSKDCLEAFQQVSEDNKAVEGMLIRLREEDGKIVATEVDEQILAIATREQIEVR